MWSGSKPIERKAVLGRIGPPKRLFLSGVEGCFSNSCISKIKFLGSELFRTFSTRARFFFQWPCLCSQLDDFVTSAKNDPSIGYVSPGRFKEIVTQIRVIISCHSARKLWDHRCSSQRLIQKQGISEGIRIVEINRCEMVLRIWSGSFSGVFYEAPAGFESSRCFSHVQCQSLLYEDDTSAARITLTTTNWLALLAMCSQLEAKRTRAAVPFGEFMFTKGTWWKWDGWDKHSMMLLPPGVPKLS